MEFYPLTSNNFESHLIAIAAAQDVEIDTISRVPEVSLEVTYTDEMTPAQIVIGDQIVAAFDDATVVEVDGTVTATCDPTDTEIVFTAFGSDGTIQEQTTIAAVGGVADYVLNLSPDTYVIRAYGIISYASGFVEAVVT